MKIESVAAKDSKTGAGSASRSPARRYAIAFLSFAIALLLRWSLEPVLKNTLPLVTLYGAVAVAVWYGRWQAAAIASLLGYLTAYYFFISSDLGSVLTKLLFRTPH
jgi:K+-sensing histidine kinase KdpD